MKVKVSKVFAAYINKTAKELGFKAQAEVVKMAEYAYRINVGDVYEADYYGDYDWRKNEFAVIRVLYPEEYYLVPRFFTTAELSKEFRRRLVTDEQGLKAMIRDMVEI